MEEALLDIEGAARFLGVSTTSLRRWTNGGRLACLRVGGRRERRFRLRDLVAFLEEQPARQHEAAPVPRASNHVRIGGRALAYGTHLCGFYSTNEGRARLTVSFLAGGLSPGSVCYVVADRPVQRDILVHLGMDQAGLQREIAAGRLVLVEHAATRQAQQMNFAEHFAAAISGGAHSLRLVGDVWGLGRKLAPDDLAEFEQALDQMSRRLPLVSLCLYDLRRFSSLDTLRALRGHGDGFRYPVERWIA
jgi:excisionase family DNA binding protein